MEILFIVAWLLLVGIATSVGSKREIGGFGAFLCALLLTPLIGFIIIAFSRSLDTVEYRQKSISKLNYIIYKLDELERLDKLERLDNLERLDKLAGLRINEDMPTKESTIISTTEEYDPGPPEVKKLSIWQRIKYGI